MVTELMIKFQLVVFSHVTFSSKVPQTTPIESQMYRPLKELRPRNKGNAITHPPVPIFYCLQMGGDWGCW